MLLHEGLERGMIFDKLIVIYEGRIPLNLFGDLAVRVKKLVK